MRLLIAATFIALMTTSALAQMGGTAAQLPGSQIGQHAAKAEEHTETKTPGQKKSDDKAYNAALRNLPDKQYDPWHGVR